MINITSENIVLVGALLLFVAVMAGKVAYRFGAPALLLFLGVGMLFGLDFISFRSVEMTQFVGMISLCIILFTGGMDTSFQEIRPILGPGIMLATAGVVMTAVILAGFVWLVAPWIGLEIPFSLALLLASTMSSTDSASVFSILRSKKQGLKQHLRPLLELESGSNDPVAYMLTVLLISVLTNSSDGSVGVGMGLVYLVVQLVVGAVAGYLIGRLAVWTINKINFVNHSLYSVLLLAFIFFAFAFTDLIKGNGYLAVYLAGLVVGNHKLKQKRPLTVFFDGFTWLMQIVMFLTLGLFVNSDELLHPEVLILGGAVGVFLILVARPVTVFACLLPFRNFSTKARMYVSWVGLRGAVPILFATYPLMAEVEHADLLFNVVFLSTIISLVVQGTTVSGMANLLGLAYEERESAFSVEMHHEEMKSALTEVEVNEGMLGTGGTLKDITLPENTLVMMVCRDGEYFVPKGNTELKAGDKLLVISDRSEELENAYRNLGIDDVMKLG
ncbi:potassium/proton antiporter [uncultured Alistipes sp.]|uniref:potassium/proton antiporter n=1 Tax=uncultured Alistipes sp. TaxID=538949 RepID=UPI003207ED63